jgi:hypothetical protein
VRFFDHIGIEKYAVFLSHVRSGYGWPTPKCRHVWISHAVFTGKKAQDTFTRNSPPSTLQEVDQQYGSTCRACLQWCMYKDASGLAYESAPMSRGSLQLERRKLGREPEVDPPDRFVPLFRIERMLFQDLHIPKMAL